MLTNGTSMIALSSPVFILAAFALLREAFKREATESYPTFLFAISFLIKLMPLLYFGISGLEVSVVYLFIPILMGFLIDISIIGRLQQEPFSKIFLFYNAFLFMIPVLDHYRLFDFIGLIGFDVLSLVLAISFIGIFFYQLGLIDISWSIPFGARRILNGVSLALLTLSFLFFLSVVINGSLIDLSDYAVLSFIFFIMLIGAFSQSAVFLKIIWGQIAEEKEKLKQMDPEFRIWNARGFINNVEAIRQICARLDQGVTLALFKIEDYPAIRQSLTPSEFIRFRLSVVEWLKFSLRKHDQLAILDENIFAVLLPFTDLDKGELACVRLKDQTRKDIQSKNFILPNDFGMRFGLTQVERKEPNVLAALTRAAEALSQAPASGISRN